MQYAIFRDWLLSLWIMPLRSTEAVACISGSFLLNAERYSILWMYRPTDPSTPSRTFVVSGFGWLQITLLPAFDLEAASLSHRVIPICVQILCEHKFSFFQDKYLEVRLLPGREFPGTPLLWLSRGYYVHYPGSEEFVTLVFGLQRISKSFLKLFPQKGPFV